MLIVRWPWGSRSMRRTRFPSSASAQPRFTAVVVLPTPPFWLATAMTLLKRWLDLCAGTWLRLFNLNRAAESSLRLWIPSPPRKGGGGTHISSTGRSDVFLRPGGDRDQCRLCADPVRAVPCQAAAVLAGLVGGARDVRAGRADGGDWRGGGLDSVHLPDLLLLRRHHARRRAGARYDLSPRAAVWTHRLTGFGRPGWRRPGGHAWREPPNGPTPDPRGAFRRYHPSRALDLQRGGDPDGRVVERPWD